MRTLSGFNFKGKVVLVRADLNCDVRKGKVVLSERIRASAETINELKKKGARVVVVAHQGRPPENRKLKIENREVGDFVSLKQHAGFLNRYVKIKFVDDVCGARAVGAIGKLKNGEAILLDNVRGVEDEFKPEKGKKNKFYALVEAVDFFVNDAFSVCHRKHASVVLFPRYLKSFAGRLLEREVGALKKIKMKNCLYVLGGAKPADNMKLLSAVGSWELGVRSKVLACGLFGQSCLVASGKKLGAQNKYLRRVVRGYVGIVSRLKRKLRNVEVPLDFAVKVGGRRKELSVDEFPCDDEIFDIGSETIEKYVSLIKKADCVFVKGPAGDSADGKFAKGTVALLRAVSKVKGFSLVGGGHLSDTIKKYKLSGFGHVSLSGGALLRYVAGEKLVGLVALGKGR